MKFRSYESHFFYALNLLSSFHLFFTLFFPQSEKTNWLFIEKTIITICNGLNIQCNLLFRISNRLYYHFNQLKCSYQILENFQEQCSRLDS